ncbi:MAG: malonic semialdehyde reductase [Lysobacteraceae bacterium]
MLDDAALDLLFRKARTYRGSATAWQDRPVDEATLRRLWDLARMGPTSANCSPARIVFVTTPAGKAELAEALDPGNVEQSMAAPVTAIVGMDIGFAEKLPYLYPGTDARSWFAGNPALTQATAFRNTTLQGAYLILAARALGLDCGPMSGFDAAKLDAAFFSGTAIRSNFIVNIGYGNPATVRPRNPRLPFDEACRIV